MQQTVRRQICTKFGRNWR